MLRVGLTGGIGCGKTTVGSLFEKREIPVIDADNIAHQLVKPGQPALHKITEAFGQDFIQPDGSLDRAKMRSLVFNNPIKKKQLEGILHPLVFAAIQAEAGQLHTRYCLISIPLLFETGAQGQVDRVLVVDCPEAIQIERVKQRDKLEEKIIHAILNSQLSRQQRLALADDIIDNSGNDGNHLVEQVENLHNFYHAISTSLR